MKPKIIKIKIKRKNKNIIHLVLPIVCISIILFLLPTEKLRNYGYRKQEIRFLLQKLKSKGRGTKIFLQQKERKVLLHLK